MGGLVPSNHVRSLVAFAALLLVSPASAWAGAKSHVSAPPGQILNLRGGAPNNGIALPLKVDVAGPDFVVPAGYSFVVTDVQIQSAGAFDDTQWFLVFVNFDDSQSRYLFATFKGAGYAQSFTTGFVMPAGATPSVVNMAGSDASVTVGVQGYLIKGEALPVNTPF